MDAKSRGFKISLRTYLVFIDCIQNIISKYIILHLNQVTHLSMFNEND